VARFERFAARRSFLVTADTLLAEADRLHLIAILRHDDVRFRRVLRRALRLVVAGYASTFEAAILLGGHYGITNLPRLSTYLPVCGPRVINVRPAVSGAADTALTVS